jgi:rhodanese-related sulfurtransferase
MKTITPFELQMLIDKADVELIDVRPKKDFEKVHALVARSIPLSELEPHSLLSHRKLDKHAPLYIMCRRKTLASLAACGLAGAGLDAPIVVEGGLEAWEGQCLPVVRKKSWRMSEMAAPTVLLISNVLLGLGLVVHELFFIAALIVFVTWAMPSVLRVLRNRREGVENATLWSHAIRICLRTTGTWRRSSKQIHFSFSIPSESS